MAKATLNPLLVEVHGKVGDMVFRRTRGGGVSLIRKADMSDVMWSPAQKADLRRFRDAVLDARQALADPDQRKRYEGIAAKTGKRAIDVAVSEHLRKQREK